LAELIKVYSGSAIPIRTWDGEDKIDEDLIDTAYVEWVNQDNTDWLRISDVQYHSGTQSLTFDTATDFNSEDEYIFTIANSLREGQIEMSFYVYGDATNDVWYTFMLSLEADEGNKGVFNITIGYNYQDIIDIKAYIYEGGGLFKEGGAIYYNSSYTHRWIGLKFVWDTTDGTYGSLKAYSDLNNTGSWSLEYSWAFESSTPDPTEIEILTKNNSGTASWDHVFIDDFIFKNVTIFDSPDYLPTKMEFYLEESNVGGGYMIIPEKNVDFSNYNTIQEDNFIVIDSDNIILFTGMFDNPIKSKDGIKLEFKEITQQLGDRICLRDYELDTGTVAEVA